MPCRFTSLILPSLFAASTLCGQGCDIPAAKQIFHGNAIRTIVGSSGSLFQNDDTNLFQVPFTGVESPHALFAGGLWVGAYNDVGDLKVAAQTYESGGRFDFSPGPLTPLGTTTPQTCANWDRIWHVSRNDVLRHIADFEDNGKIDDTIPAIFAWPGNGNPYFEEFNGFPMPDYYGFGAPFKYITSNYTYDPHLGEFPYPYDWRFNHATVHPMYMTWSVFNDNGGMHDVTEGEPVRVEVAHTTYAYSCDDVPLLDQTLFMSFQITNRSTSLLDSIAVGLWLDPQLGCFADDYTGSFPQRNTFFMYNADNTDGIFDDTCPTGSGVLQTYGENPPVLSVTFLNQPMTSFMYFNNPSIGNTPPGTRAPRFGHPQEFYNLLTGTWRDGTPLFSGGAGYTMVPDTQTAFAFPGDPRDTTSWAMTNIEPGYQDIQIVGSTMIPRLQPGLSEVIHIAIAYHRDTSQSNLNNVALMYGGIDQLQNYYDYGIAPQCPYNPDPCIDDCVYPGDANHDGKVNLFDYLNVFVALQNAGPTRKGPLAFIPLPSADWGASTWDSVNYKHVDCNGDGRIDLADIDIIDLHYGLQSPNYTHHPATAQDDQIRITPEDFDIAPGELFFRVEVEFFPDTHALYGLAFAFEYDTNVFASSIQYVYPLWEDEDMFSNSTAPLAGSSTSSAVQIMKSATPVTRDSWRSSSLPAKTL